MSLLPAGTGDRVGCGVPDAVTDDDDDVDGVKDGEYDVDGVDDAELDGEAAIEGVVDVEAVELGVIAVAEDDGEVEVVGGSGVTGSPAQVVESRLYILPPKQPTPPANGWI